MILNFLVPSLNLTHKVSPTSRPLGNRFPPVCMFANLLTLNSSKTEFLIFVLKQQLSKIDNSSLNTTHFARNVGFIFYENLTFSGQICHHQWSNYEGGWGGLAPLKDQVAPSKHLVWEGTRGPLKGPLEINHPSSIQIRLHNITHSFTGYYKLTNQIKSNQFICQQTK